MEEKKVIIELTSPLPSLGDGLPPVTRLELGRLKLRHLELLPPTFFEDEEFSPKNLLPLLVALTGLPVEVLGEIDVVDDIPKIAEEIKSFFQKLSPEIGKK